MSTVTTAPPAAAGPSNTSRGSQRRRRPRRTPNTPTERQESGQAQAHALVPSQVISQRGGRGGRGRGGARGGQAEAELPLALQTEATDQQIAPPTNRGGRGGRARGRGPRFGPRVAAGGRQFGGQLTTEGDAFSEAGSQGNSGLQADAPVFQPGQPIVPHKQRAPREKRPQLPKSNAPDIATRTHEDIDNGHYECAICTEEIKRHSRGIWSCRTCWTVFHLACIKKWSTNEGSAAARQQAQDGEIPPQRQWRCPGCNLPKDTLPKNFHCWCEKELDPKALPGLPPFSCGQTCARPRVLPKSCPHPCPVTCHAGPCPPCGLMGPTKPCFCGKKSVTRRCADTDYEHGWGCGEVCGEVMTCGEHRCSRSCHDGPCGPCEIRVPARCYCGQTQKDILCRERSEKKQSKQSHTAADGTVVMEEWIGTFACPNMCSRPFDCGHHVCQKSCHQQDAKAPHCPRSPDLVTHCPCGKTLLKEMTNANRTTCEDAIPNCAKPCYKTLDCGHPCERLCHQGECSPCFRRVSIACRCGRTSSESICHQGTEEAPQCMRICRVSLNCGRHECGERCCAGERKAAERQSNRRKARPLDAAPRRPGDNFEAEHICTRSCGRQLKCGNPEHRCQELCHKGPCGTCREAIFDELGCHCGRTVLQPPLPCGTKPPPCRFACDRPKDCGHPQIGHNCHGDEEGCPKCPFLTTKTCLCSKNVLKNQPCWLSDVRCGDICGKTLRCGAHKCQKQCHRPGECEEPCRQPCGKELSVCGHPCLSPCHFPSICKEEKPCQHKIFITCDCQRIKQETKCTASKQGDGNTKKMLKCDEECARLERNHKLALALNVDPEHQNDHVPYSADTLNMYNQNSTWAAAQEKQLRLFAADPKAKRFRFKPMQRQHRAFVHSLAEDFGFDTESMDPEPHRHVAIFKTPRFVMAPMKTLAESSRTRQVQRPIPAPAPAAINTLRPKPSNTTGDPYNAFLVTNPRFALTIEEVSTVVRSVLSKTSFSLDLEPNFLPSEAVALKPPLVARLHIDERTMQKQLESVQEPLSQAFTANKIGKIQLARLDASLNILRKESDIGPGSGWSTVAAAKSAPLRQVARGTAFGNKGGFAVLSLSSNKKKKAKETVVEDWEAAEEQEEEKELKASGSGAVSENEGGTIVGESATASSSQSASVAAAEGSSDEANIPMTPGTTRWADMDDE